MTAPRDVTFRDVTVTDGDRELQFRGKLLGAVTSREDDGQKKHWYTDLDLYQTEKGTFVGIRTTVRDGDERVSWLVARTETEIQDWVGFGALSLELYREAGWGI